MAFAIKPDPLTKHLKMNALHINGQDPVAQALLTDDYQINMAYAYWQQGKHDSKARFELFFRKNPFKGEFTIFAGLEDCLHFVRNFRFIESDLEYLKAKLPHAKPAFFDYLEKIDCSKLTVQAIPEGTVVFPKVPLIIVEGPLAICQLLETPLLNLVNFASLVTTNAARFRLAAGNDIELLEFGLRRAQGPNGGLSASKYCYVGGFDCTSNLLAGKLFNIPVKGTMAHSYVTSYDEDPLKEPMLREKGGTREINLQTLARQKLDELLEMVLNGANNEREETNQFTNKFDWAVTITGDSANKGELNAFCAYAIAHPHAFLALIDTYDTLKSGLINFCAVSLALDELGYSALGCRIDSGDLAYLSKEIRNWLGIVAEKMKSKYGKDKDWIAKLKIVASNDINEETIRSLNDQKHSIDAFGVGTHLVTCQKQPALGCVYKLVDLDGKPKIKLSEDVGKLTIPGRKKAFRLYNKSGVPLVDLMVLTDEQDPRPGMDILCRHPFESSKRARVNPARVEALHRIYWQGVRFSEEMPDLQHIREHTRQSISSLRPDHIRALNPTPYKVSLSEKLYKYFEETRLNMTPIGRLT